MFQLAYTPFIWPFVISCCITTVLGVYAYHRRHLPAVPILAWLMFALTIWTFCYTLELASVTLEGKTLWSSAKYFGSTTGPVAWFVLALHLTKNKHWLTPSLRMVLSTFVIVTCLVVFTNDVHHWYWTNLYLVSGFPETQTEHGFFFWVYAAMVYSLVLTSFVLFFQYFRSTPRMYQRQALLLALTGFVPLGGRFLEDFFSIDLFPKVDNIVLLFLLSGVLFAVAIFRYGAFHIVHIAHNLVIQNITAGIIVLDTSEHVVELNPYAKVLVGVAHTEAVGQPLRDVLYGWPQFELKLGAEQEIAVEHATGTQWFHLQSSQIKAENGAAAGTVLVLFDITARKQAEHQLAALAHTDALTGLTNRRHFFELAEPVVERARRYGRALAVVMFDIDHFKKVNDTYGHQAGDAVIKFVAARSRQEFRTTDVLARYGGEEFICLLDEATSEDAYRAAERVRQVIADACVDTGQHRLHCTISLGVACLAVQDGEQDLGELIRQADEALYVSKANGRNQVQIWQPVEQLDTAHSPTPGERAVTTENYASANSLMNAPMQRIAVQ